MRGGGQAFLATQNLTVNIYLSSYNTHIHTFALIDMLSCPSQCLLRGVGLNPTATI